MLQVSSVGSPHYQDKRRRQKVFGCIYEIVWRNLLLLSEQISLFLLGIIISFWFMVMSRSLHRKIRCDQKAERNEREKKKKLEVEGCIILVSSILIDQRSF